MKLLMVVLSGCGALRFQRSLTAVGGVRSDTGGDAEAEAGRVLALSRKYYCLRDAAGLGTCSVEVPDEAAFDRATGGRRRTFALPDRYEPLSVRETSFYEGKLGYQLWHASVALSTWLRGHEAQLRDKSVLELGSGVGLAGLACAAIARSVTLSDMDRVRDDDLDSPPGLLDGLRRSIEENGLANVDVRRIDWKERAEPDRLFDVIVASDCIYYPELLEPFAATIRAYLAPAGVAYVMSTQRDWTGAKYPRSNPEDLVAVLNAAGWCEFTETRFTTVTPDSEQTVVLHEVRWRQ